eukprot:1016066-Rhodomonas_salina.1
MGWRASARGCSLCTRVLSDVCRVTCCRTPKFICCRSSQDRGRRHVLAPASSACARALCTAGACMLLSDACASTVLSVLGPARSSSNGVSLSVVRR